MKKQDRQKRTLDEDNEKFTDFSILEALYEIGEKCVKRITSFYPSIYPLDGKEAYAASEINRRIGHGWSMQTGSHEFSIQVGTFQCSASYDNIFDLITRFEKICGVRPRNRKTFVLETK